MIDSIIQGQFSGLIAGVHPAAEIFPLPTDEELEAICKSFREQGQTMPIIVDAQTRLLIDGRSRLLAAHRTQLEPKIEYRMVKDPWGLSMVLNMDRRHLTSEQKKRVYVLVREQRGVRERGGQDGNCNAAADKTKVSNDTFVKPTQSDYANEMGVSLPTVKRWEADAKVLDAAPEMKQAVMDGEKSVRDAVTEALLKEKSETIQKLIQERDREKQKRKQAEAVTKASDRELELAKQKAEAEERAAKAESRAASLQAQVDGGLGVAELLEPKVVIQEDTESKRELERVRKQLEEKTRLHEMAAKHAGQFQDEMHKATSKVAYLENKLKEVEDTSVVLAVFARQVNDWKSQVGFVAAVLKDRGQTLDDATVQTCSEIADRLYQLVEFAQDQESLEAA